ncbi:MAG: hypothetical protein MK207_15875 [Saprospiraceae bacterium]|nr:hypothetical protein [Saprospiraceae bacterium]
MSQTQVAQAEFVGMLKPLIDPSSNVDSLCIDYYQHWKYNKDIKSFPLKIKIGKIDKHSKDRATVQISNIWNWPTGEKYFFLSESTWIKKDDKWYRTDQPAKIIEKRKIEEK